MITKVHPLIPELPEDLAPESRVWIYMADRQLTGEEANQLQPVVEAFAEQWVSHNRNLHSFGKVYHDRFIVLAVDETHAGASGCSIDTSVRFVKMLGEKLGIDWFDRMQVAILDEEGKIAGLPFAVVREQYAEGSIGGQTQIFDNLVQDKAGFEAGWIKPLSDSWIQRLVG